MGPACPSCGEHVLPDKRFCGACGARLAAGAADRFAAPETYTPKHLADRILTALAALEGERKQVTVLFADLKGSMELLADRDPEDARKLLDAVLERMMEAVHRFDGTVNQVMGDGIMALFGAPIAHEDHAVRASYAALRMQEEVGRYGAELRRSEGLDVLIRVGLNSGEVVVRTIGSDLRMDYTAVGQTTHLAARMEQLARPGTILMTPHTRRLAEGSVEVRSLGPVPVKGVAEPMEVFELVRAASPRSRLELSAAQGLTRFVGRQRELGQLAEALARSCQGSGQVVALVGEVGAGKSRLVWEFTHSAEVERCRVLASNAVAYGKPPPYLSIVDLLRGCFRIEEQDDARQMRDKVESRCLALGEGVRRLMPALLALLDLPVEDPEWGTPDPTLRRRRITDAVTHLLMRESQEQPLLVIVEGLHRADSETLALLEHLVSRIPAARCLLLVTYRSDFHLDWAGRGAVTQIRLGPLPAADAETLLALLLGDDASLTPVVRLVADRTDGNPLFLEESVRSLVETGALAGERGAYRLVQPVTEIQMPATVQAVLAARIDRLAAADKWLLQAAAVVGRHVPYPLLREVADLPEATLRSSLDHLQAGEFMYERGLFPDLEYAFTHALTHDVAYGSLLHERRDGLHREILLAMERLYPDRVAEQVELRAHHAFRGEVWDKAVTYLRHAGLKAAERAANPEAVASFEQALTALARLPASREVTEQAIDVRLEMRPPLLQLGDLGRVHALSHEAEALATEIGDEPRLARVYTYLINYHYLKGEPDRAIAYGERCLAIGEAAGDVALQALARGYMGYSHHAQGHYAEAEAVLRRNVESAGEGSVAAAGPQGHVLYVSSAGWLGFARADRGEFEAALRYAEMAQRAGEASPNPYAQAIAWTMSGLVHLRRGHLEPAVSFLERSLTVCREKHLTVWRPIPSSLLGLAYALGGRVQDGLALLSEGVTLSDEMGVKAYLSLWTAHLAEGLLAAGQIERARAVAERALSLAETHKEEGHRAWTLALLGEIAAAAEPLDPVAAERALTEAATIAHRLELRPLIGRVHLGLGRLHLRVGRAAGAEQELIAAIQLFGEMEMRLWIEQAAHELRRLGRLFIVAHDNVAFHRFLAERFAGDPAVTVILDRRRGGDGAVGAAPVVERRQRTDVDPRVRARGVAVLSDETGANGGNARSAESRPAGPGPGS
jgi:class 3 adenylate cyclase/tetratricopeptide (TPR) repeat protein